MNIIFGKLKFQNVGGNRSHAKRFWKFGLIKNMLAEGGHVLCCGKARAFFLYEITSGNRNMPIKKKLLLQEEF